MKEDVEAVTNSKSCRFLSYEIERVTHLLGNLEDILKIWNEMLKNAAPPQDRVLASEVVDKVEAIKEQLQQLLSDLKCGTEGDAVWPHYSELVFAIESVHQVIESFHLPSLCDDILDLTDAGPGVGISNLQVRYRDAEIARMHKSKRRNRIHRARNDSSQNEAERTNAAIGEALADGSTIKWRYFDATDGMTVEQIQEMTNEEMIAAEDECMRRNAWKVCEDVCSRIDGEPAPSGDMTAYVTHKEGKHMFWNAVYLDEFIKASAGKKDDVPGRAYFRKLERFISHHYEVGDLYMEYTRGSCKKTIGQLCEFCKGSRPVTSEVARVRRPFPDYNREGLHYCSLEETPSEGREVDDYQPRVVLRKLFAEGKMNDDDAIENFSRKYVVEKRLVKQYLDHLLELERKRNKRTESRKKANLEENRKSFADYNWEAMYREGTLKKLKVKILDLYVMERKLKHSKGALKQEKIDLITIDIAKKIIEGSENLDDSDCDDDVDDDIDDGNDDGVLDEIGEDDSDDDISEDSDEDQEEDESVQQENNFENLLHTTRYGRTCRTWRGRARAADFS